MNSPESTYKAITLLLILFMQSFFCAIEAQQNDSTIVVNDSLSQSASIYGDTIKAIFEKNDSIAIDSVYNDSHNSALTNLDSSRISMKRGESSQNKISLTPFRPNPTKATWYAVVFPGAGQIYNKKYWKLPIVYGGFMGCLYAFNWNDQMYSDYRQAYLDIMDTDPNTASYENFLPPGYNIEGNTEYLKNLFKKRKDRYRRWRDLSVFAFVGVYLLSIADAYVDAQLSSFDISKDLNMSIKPDLIRADRDGTTGIGFQCSLTF